MTITVKETRHTRKQGSNVRRLNFDNKDEHDAICSSNVTTQGIDGNDNALYAWGDWDVFNKIMTERGYNIA